MPQKISWMPCIWPPAREAAGHGHGLGHLTLRCEACSADDYRDTTFYQPPHQAGHAGILTGWTTQPDT